MANLPGLTSDLDIIKNDLDTHGYGLLEDALTADDLQRARRRLTEQAEAERAMGIAFEDGGANQPLTGADDKFIQGAFTAANGGVNQRLWMLINKGKIFRELAIHAQVLELVRHVLGKEFQLSTLSANIAKPGGVEMGLHTDQWWMPVSKPPAEEHIRPGSITRTDFGYQPATNRPVVAPPVMCNVAFMLTDFTAENGGTVIVPGSHRSGRQPNKRDHGQQIPVTGPAGSAFIFDGRLFHGTGANTTKDSQRIAVLVTYCAPQVRTQENYTLGMLPEVYDEASDELLALLGFRPWNAYGRTGDPHVPMVGRHDLSIFVGVGSALGVESGG